VIEDLLSMALLLLWTLLLKDLLEIGLRKRLSIINLRALLWLINLLLRCKYLLLPLLKLLLRLGRGYNEYLL
jgi:hypothetical protein